jgi:hypothetical protein
MDNFSQTEISRFWNKTIILNYNAYGEIICFCNLKPHTSLRHVETSTGFYSQIIMQRWKKRGWITDGQLWRIR